MVEWMEEQTNYVWWDGWKNNLTTYGGMDGRTN